MCMWVLEEGACWAVDLGGKMAWGMPGSKADSPGAAHSWPAAGNQNGRQQSSQSRLSFSGRLGLDAARSSSQQLEQLSECQGGTV